MPYVSAHRTPHTASHRLRTGQNNLPFFVLKPNFFSIFARIFMKSD
jgi:hypothetical protein